MSTAAVPRCGSLAVETQLYNPSFGKFPYLLKQNDRIQTNFYSVSGLLAT